MATTQTTQLSRGGQFSGWKLWVLLAAAAAIAATLVGRGLVIGGAETETRPAASIHNLVEDISVFGASVAEAFDPPRNLIEGIDEFAPASAGVAALQPTMRPNLLEGVDGTAVPGGAAAASAYTAYKIEQVREAAGGGASVAPAPDAPAHPNLVEGP